MRLIPDAINLDDYIAGPDESGLVRAASDWADEVVARFHSPERDFGTPMGWSKTHDKLRFRPAEVTLWPGINGHGKSMFTSQVALDLQIAGEPVCMASFEMKPAATMQRMTRQAFGGALPDTEFIRRFHNWTDARLWLYDVQGQVKADRVIACGRYAATLGVKHFFIDSLMKCVRGEDDYNGQKDFIDRVCSLAKETGMHVHVVHHVRKMADETQKPGKFDAKGSGAITDQVDNVLTVWRNKRKERAREENTMTPDQVNEPDCFLICDKQRNGEWEGKFGFWFHPAAMQFMQYGTECDARHYFD